ncbi:MAG TPA: hydrogenase expression/formation protein HypE, partial [Akkermansia sp.]|nr:hydrogenase expression/formation protein HypE [Akkermansia sp.]
MFECPVPEPVSDRIQMAHGGGGRLMNELIRSVFLSAFGSPSGGVQNDAAVLEVPPGRLAMTTDSFVVQPLEFPGGSIGSLAVHGTVNDLAMSGAEPLYLTAGFILEEGLPLEVLT